MTDKKKKNRDGGVLFLLLRALFVYFHFMKVNKYIEFNQRQKNVQVKLKM